MSYAEIAKTKEWSPQPSDYKAVSGHENSPDKKRQHLLGGTDSLFTDTTFFELDCELELVSGCVSNMENSEDAKIGFSHDKFLNVTEHFNGFCSSRIRLDTFLGSGGMGNVFLAHADAENRMVAVKVAKDGLGLPSVQTRFLNERQILLQTDSPGIVTLLGSGTTDQGIPFLVLEWINGSSIDQYCREFNPSLQSKGNLFLDICRAVQASHVSGVVHCDLKPANILIQQERTLPVVKLIDFGISKISKETFSSHADDQYAGESIAGTLQYMSPEQLTADHSPVDHRTDIYSLGNILFELATGSPPISSADLRRRELGCIMEQIVSSPRPSLINSLTCPPQQDELQFLLALEEIVAKCTDKNIEDRYDDVASLMFELERAIDTPAVPIKKRPRCSELDSGGVSQQPMATHRRLFNRRRQRIFGTSSHDKLSVGFISTCLLIAMLFLWPSLARKNSPVNEMGSQAFIKSGSKKEFKPSSAGSAPAPKKTRLPHSPKNLGDTEKFQLQLSEKFLIPRRLFAGTWDAGFFFQEKLDGGTGTLRVGPLSKINKIDWLTQSELEQPDVDETLSRKIQSASLERITTFCEQVDLFQLRPVVQNKIKFVLEGGSKKPGDQQTRETACR